VFKVTGRRLVPWPDPHPGRSPLEEEYSRLTDPTKWRIIGARADAWVLALTDAGLAMVQRDTSVHWRGTPGTVILRTDRVVPYATGAVPLVVARSRIGDIDDAGVTLGAGDPAVCVTWIPGCGCDACDSGSQNELDDLDAHILAIVSGVFRRLSARGCEITVLGDGSWSASGASLPRDIPAIIAEPSGWKDLSGTSWLDND